jgi:hypothetical protein
MKVRLITALISGTIGAGVGVAVALWQVPDYLVSISIAMALIGFMFGLVFKLQAL